QKRKSRSRKPAGIERPDFQSAEAGVECSRHRNARPDVSRFSKRQPPPESSGGWVRLEGQETLLDRQGRGMSRTEEYAAGRILQREHHGFVGIHHAVREERY